MDLGIAIMLDQSSRGSGTGMGRWGLLLAMVLPLSLSSEPQHYDLLTFGLSAPSGVGWEVMSHGVESIWFRRAASEREFSMIGITAMKEIAQDRWTMSDQELAQAVIQDYRQSTLRSGHVFTDETFETLTIEGKRFFADTALLPVIHTLPVDPNYMAHELVYIFIVPRKPAAHPFLYFFLFTDVHRKDHIFNDDLQEFLSVLKSFEPKPPGEPI